MRAVHNLLTFWLMYTYGMWQHPPTQCSCVCSSPIRTVVYIPQTQRYTGDKILKKPYNCFTFTLQSNTEHKNIFQLFELGYKKQNKNRYIQIFPLLFKKWCLAEKYSCPFNYRKPQFIYWDVIEKNPTKTVTNCQVELK